MRNGFASLVNSGTPVSRVDLEATRIQREQLHQELQLRTHLVRLLLSTYPSDGSVRIEIAEDGADS